ncbi:hypothetical protein QC763_0062430 [Podospora pseudopauciseta]|uniref:Uncharacterized protein n=1 Tax=Podospora pseudopauciseta TaxID=2093780 RepID=A0ABR0HC51_9PEZI|nr:hypothetical protein QC763_0062430 [Podospora pseudopauciseta]
MENAGIAANKFLTTKTADDFHDFEKHLIVASLTIAHELVHVFVGRLTGVNDADTPPKIDVPPKTGMALSLGESGRYWETKFVGYSVWAFYDDKDIRKEAQGGTLWADIQRTKGSTLESHLVPHPWVKNMLAGVFAHVPAGPKPLKRPATAKQLRDKRAAMNPHYIDGDPALKNFIVQLSKLQPYTLEGADYARVQGIAANPGKIVV